MANVLILFAHPALEKSRVHKRLLAQIPAGTDVRLHDLYEHYPNFDIDIAYEQQLLLQHDVIVFQHPLYWYSSPALIKQWLDLVLEHGWAYGSKGTALKGKKWLQVVSSGGSAEAYKETGRNKFPLTQYLLPFRQTATLCGMEFLPPFVVHGTHRLNEADIELHALQYEQLLFALRQNRITDDELKGVQYINEIIPIPHAIQS
ncbi:MAG: NAD(P)H oxidoreductase [Lacibacter sp.]|jgi:glutathione-regulated potassium-efflux system ancillary protein KefG